jgi:hypothetical protein
LVRAYRFPRFELVGVDFYSNLGDASRQEVAGASLADPVLARVCLANLLIPVGRPADGSYDPVCFDLRRRQREAPLVRVDHEQALIRERAVVVRELLPSFLQLIQSMSSPSGP